MAGRRPRDDEAAGVVTGVPWGKVHVGDQVRVKDQRAWTVVGREEGPSWIVNGEYGWFRLTLDGHEVKIAKPLNEPVELVHRADHSATAGVVDTFLQQGIELQIVREGRMEPSQPAPRKEEKRDRWGRYLLPDPQTGEEYAWTRVSTVARTLADEWNLTQHEKRMVAKGVAMRSDLIAGAAAADPESDKSTLDKIAQQAKDHAGGQKGSNFGTALHSFAQRLDQGEALDALGAQPPLDADLKAYAELLRAKKLIPQHMERIVVLPELKVAGKFDRIVGQPPGQAKAAPLSILDLKSGKTVEYSWLEIVIQQALYSRAALMWNQDTDTYEEMPLVDQDRGLVIHMPVGRASPQLYAVNLMKGWEWAQLAMKVRAARSEAKKGVAWLVEPSPAELALHNVSRAASQQELADLWEKYQPKGLWTEEVHEAAQERFGFIRNRGVI